MKYPRSHIGEILEHAEKVLWNTGWFVRRLRVDFLETGGLRLLARVRHREGKFDQIIQREILTEQEERALDGPGPNELYERILAVLSELEKPRQYHVAFRPGRRRYPLGTGVTSLEWRRARARDLAFRDALLQGRHHP